MKKNLLLLTFTMLLFTSLSQAQLIKVWDFGAVQLDGATYDNQLNDTNMNSVINLNSGTVAQGVANSDNQIASPGLDFGAIKYVTDGTNDRLRTTNTALTRRDDNGGANFADLGLAGRIYVNSSGKRTRYMSITTTEANQEVTIIMRGENVDGSGNFGHHIDSADGTTFTFFTPLIDSDIKELHITLPSAGEYQYYDDIGKPSWYRIYFGNVTLDGIDADDVIGNRLSADDFASQVSTNVKAVKSRVYISNVKSSTEVRVFSITGALVKSFKTSEDTSFNLKQGLYIATVKTLEGQKSVKVLTR
ncbi:T9SS type A sorting domain-containing protein [Thalassobellus sediminis]|uniref:T9SS type A sorting domain-containing protein n=1 Tax=Thalassobellus sediminis TaxID=3367753 RepID=UPI00378C71F8